ncbi:MAG: hypothetical protein H8D87_07340 [Deltaproteobacteria bacterium]|nr:hypothetical protein [Candidatus Desulfobacula maris]
MFSGDTFDPFGENNKISLTNKLKELSDYVASLPGEKYLVWGEGIVNNRHLIGKRLSGLGVNILEDEEVSSKKFPEFFIVGKLPELADFVLRTKSDGNKFLSATDTNLNSFLHYQVGSYQELNDYDFLGEFQFNSKDGGLGLTFYSQYNRFSDQFYRIRWSGRSSVPEISPHGTGLLTGRVRARHPLLPEKLYQFRIRCKTETDATRISAKFWRKGDPEPFDWDINAFDSSASRLTSGTIGVWVNGPSVLKLFDNFIVQSADGDHVFVHENFDDSNLYNNRWRTERNFTDEITSSQEDRVSILLTHTPEIINNYSIKDFNLILTGDIYGGQVRWPWGTPLYWDKNLPKDWSSGLHNTIKDIPIYISKGVGFSRLPIRLFCRPEIVVFELNSKQ